MGYTLYKYSRKRESREHRSNKKRAISETPPPPKKRYHSNIALRIDSLIGRSMQLVQFDKHHTNLRKNKENKQARTICKNLLPGLQAQSFNQKSPCTYFPKGGS